MQLPLPAPAPWRGVTQRCTSMFCTFHFCFWSHCQPLCFYCSTGVCIELVALVTRPGGFSTVPPPLLLSCSAIISLLFIIITLHVIWLPLLVTGMHWDVYCLILFYYFLYYLCGYLPHILLCIFVHWLCITEWVRGWHYYCIHVANL